MNPLLPVRIKVAGSAVLTVLVNVLVLWALLSWLSTCTTMESQEKESAYNCPGVVWKYWAAAPMDHKQDWLHEQSARRGCIRYYGPGACLVSMTKTGVDSYWAICRRKIQ